MSIKRTIGIYTLYLGFLLLLMGIILTILGILGVFYIENLDGSLNNLMDQIGDYKYWCILIGPVLILAGGWYFYDNLNKRREFAELMETTSKKMFIKNLDRLEFLAWKLTPWHQVELTKKKKKFHVK